MSDASTYVVGILIVIASLFTLTASIGLLRLPDLYTRMHAASKAGTVGSCVMLLALAIDASEWSISTRAIAGIAFFLLTVPISSHLLAKAAHVAGYPLSGHSVRDDLALDNRARRLDTEESPAKQTGVQGEN
jgi:multicomponent Na+:H+ antiporter subunit G